MAALRSPVRSPVRSPIRFPTEDVESVAVTPIITLTSSTVIDDAIIGTVVGYFTVQNGTGVYAFTITDDPDLKFVLDIAEFPNLVTADAISYETATTHSVTVEADNGVDTPITQQFDINVTDVAEATINLSTSTINENAEVGDEVGVLSVTGGMGQYVFSVLTDVDDKFVVDEDDTSLLQLKNLLDYETATSHSVTIQADNGVQVPSLQEFTYTVLDDLIDANIVLSAYSIAEDASAGDLVGNLSVTDGTGSYTFSITVDADSKFVLDGVDNTRLELENTLDYETATFHKVTISADNGVDDPTVQELTVNVTNVVEAASLVDLTLTPLDVDENTPFGTVVGALTGYAVGSTLLIQDGAGGRFYVDGTNVEAGQIGTDYSTATSHQIIVREILEDAPNSPHDSLFTIIVNNVAPVLSALVVTPNPDDYTTADISLNTTDGDGMMYFVVVPTGATAPTAEQIAAGTDGDDVAATWADDVEVSGIDTYLEGPTGLNETSVYDCYVVQYDASLVVSNIVTVEFTAGEALSRYYMAGIEYPTFIKDEGAGRFHVIVNSVFGSTVGAAAPVASSAIGEYMIGGELLPVYINDDITGRQAQHGRTFLNGVA
jgi:hypothetical protein